MPTKDEKMKRLALLIDMVGPGPFHKKMTRNGKVPGPAYMTIKRWHDRLCLPPTDEDKYPFFKTHAIDTLLDLDHSREELTQAFMTSLASLGMTAIRPGDIAARLAQSGVTPSGSPAPYAGFERLNDPALPYYRDRAKPGFLAAHLEIVADRIGPERFARLKAKLLTETVDGRELLFPAVSLMPDGVPLALDKDLKSKSPRPDYEVPQPFIDAVRITRPRITDNPTFALHDLDPVTGTMTCFMSTYFKALYECDRFFYQIVANFPGLAGDLAAYRPQAFLRDWSDRLGHIAADGHYAASELSIGCSCLLITNTPNGYEALLCRKSSAANGMHDIHVIPAFMFQPIGNVAIRFGREINIRDQVFRELMEEVFGTPEFDSSVHTLHLYNQILEQEEVAHIAGLLDRGGAEFHVTGLYLDLFRLRPEITTVMIIHDRDWFAKHVRPDRILGSWETVELGVMSVEMNDHTYEQILTRSEGELCAPGAAAYITGYRKFKEVMNR